MRRLMLVALLALAVAGCSGDDESSKFDNVVNWVRDNCGVLVTVATVAVVSSSGPLAGASVAAIGNEICVAFKSMSATSSVTALMAQPACPMVDGQCIEGTVTDPDKLEGFEPKEE